MITQNELFYEELVTELRKLKKSNVTEGEWEVFDKSNYIFFMRSMNEDFPVMEIGVRTGKFVGALVHIIVYGN